MYRIVGAERHTESLTRLQDFLLAVPDAEELEMMQKPLISIKNALDNGRRINVSRNGVERGMPLWMLTKVLKASWHADGSWPIIGRDEAAQHGVCDPEACIVGAIQVSQHPHSKVVRCDAYERGKKAGTILPCKFGVREPVILGPSAAEIAAAYATRRDAA